MKPSGTIYHSSQSKSGELRIALTEKEQKHFNFMRFMGANMSSLALAFMVFFYGPIFELDLDYQAGLARANNQLAENSISENIQISATPEPLAINQFVISIPAIGATSRVVPNVNPFDENVYNEALKQGIAHAANTKNPGDGGRIYLFAHSTTSPANFSEYNAVFYQLRLLSEGSRIFINYNGGTYQYVVKEKVVVAANDTHWLTDPGSEEELVLQTCDPPGTTLRRLLVIARPIDKN